MNIVRTLPLETCLESSATIPKTCIVLTLEIVFLLFVFNHIFKTQFGLNHCKYTGQQVIECIISPDIILTGNDEKI